jgi:hypothetical protein
LQRFGLDEGVDTVGLPMERGLSPFRDVVSLFRLWREFRRLRPQLVECGTPKAGLLGGMAARLAGTPASIYTLHGLRFETLHGWRRSLSRFAEKLTVRLADETLCVGRGLLRQARALGTIPAHRGLVAGPEAPPASTRPDSLESLAAVRGARPSDSLAGSRATRVSSS